MKPVWRKFFAVIGGLVILVFLAGIIAPFFVPWNKVKDDACRMLSEKIHHRVTIQSVRFNPFTGIHLSGVQVDNAAGFSNQPLFSNQEAVVSYSLLSLFSGKLVLSEIEFKQPRILIEKDAKGRFNFSDMTAPPAAAAPRAKGPAKPEARQGAGFPVLVTSFRISNGDFVYHDVAAAKTSTLSNLNLDVQGFSLLGGGSSHARLQMAVETDGQKIPLDLGVDFKLAPGLDGVDIPKATMDLEFGGQSAKLVMTGGYHGHQADANLDLAAFGGSLQAKTRADLAAGPSLSFAVKATGMQIANAVQLYAGMVPKNANVQDLKGKLSGVLELALSGTAHGSDLLKAADAKGAYSLKNVTLSRLNITEKLAAAIPYPPVSGILRKDIHFDLLQSDLRLAGGKLSWDSFTAGSGADNRSGDLFVESKGWLIPSKDVDLHATLHFNPRAVQLGDPNLASAFNDAKGWPSFDVAYYGPNFKSAKADFSQGLRKAAGQALGKQAGEAGKQLQKYLQQQGGDLFKNLFGH